MAPAAHEQRSIGPDAAIWSARRRLLALDGGGIRGIVSIAFLERIEALLAARAGTGANFRLADHFHLIGGTSTGAIIAAGLALGRSVAEIKTLYFELGPAIFRRRWHIPLLQARYGSAALGAILDRAFGPITLGDPSLRTLLAIIAKRADTGSPWIISNLPDQPYWNDRDEGTHIAEGNRNMRLSALVRASAAAPFFFAPERIRVSSTATGVFVDGAVSPYNSPSIPLLLLATAKRYGLDWPLGPRRLSMVSIGTGRHAPPPPSPWTPSAVLAVEGLRSMIEDTMSLSLMMMQWLGESEAPNWLNRDIETLEDDPLAGRPLFSFQRFDLRLDEEWLETYFGLPFEAREVLRLRRLDDPAAMPALYDLARLAAERVIRLE